MVVSFAEVLMVVANRRKARMILPVARLSRPTSLIAVDGTNGTDSSPRATDSDTDADVNDGDRKHNHEGGLTLKQADQRLQESVGFDLDNGDSVPRWRKHGVGSFSCNPGAIGDSCC